MKKFLLSITVLLSLVLSCGTSNDEAKNVIKVGVPVPLTGDLAQYGQSIKEGIELYIDKINNDKILDKQIVAEYVDSKGDIQEDINIFKKMASNKVDYILGEAASAHSLAVAELANKAKIPMITPAATAMSVTEGKEYVFRISFTDPYQGEMMAKYLNKEKINKVALLVNNSSDYSVGVAKAFNEQSEKLGLSVYELRYTKEDTDFKSLLTDIKNKDIKNVFIPDYYNTVGLILSQAKEVNLDAMFFGADGWDGIQENFAKVADGAVFSSQFVDDENIEQSKEFIKEYKARFKKSPTIFSALGYDAATVLVEGIKKGGNLDAFKGLDVNLVTGHITFDENRNPKKDVLFVEVKDGKVILKEKFGE
ncbi:ABC transporter substrate-binding protein [Oceanivirga miroungae]|uniref:Extracellular ligand-binding receptor n=1 Tax=Oceanivirga miroungae TaxID=1130046 RepID=A0A6I8MBY6_9FUSO|nr:ABC transporter substrate-binding protein [Oceanivirga miroungae]VWL85723.1 extracellular ligand-binding receptor [Oceanivirga miroungae]